MMDTDELELHIPRLRRYAYALLRDRARADDLVQDTLERALRKFSLWRRGSDLRAWLFTVMHNVHLNQLRSNHEGLSGNEDYEGENLLPVRATQEDTLEIRDLANALERLPVEFRKVVLLVGLEQFSYDETARVLGVPRGTVMSRLARGREQLRSLMAGDPLPHLRRGKGTRTYDRSPKTSYTPTRTDGWTRRAERK